MQRMWVSRLRAAAARAADAQPPPQSDRGNRPLGDADAPRPDGYESFLAPCEAAECGDIPTIDQDAADRSEGIVSDRDASPEAGQKPCRRPKNKGGRTSKWTPEVAFKLAQRLPKKWLSPREIARQAGVGRSTLWTRYRLGHAGDPRFKCLVRPMSVYERQRAGWWAE
jgi:hypothetical protein